MTVVLGIAALSAALLVMAMSLIAKEILRRGHHYEDLIRP